MSIKALEVELLELIKASPLKDRLRVIDCLPDAEHETLVKHFATDAPAVYVAYAGASSRNTINEVLSFSVICVARNSRGHKAAKHGDGHVIGLYDIVDAVKAIANKNSTDITTWSVGNDRPLHSVKLYDENLYAQIVDVKTGEIKIPSPTDLDALENFETYNAEHKTTQYAPAATDKVTLEQNP